MTQYKLRGRDERINDLMSSFAEKENNHKKTMYLIDSSFKHKQIKQWGDAQKTIFDETVNELIEKERINMKQEQLEEEAEQFRILEKKLGNYIKCPDQHKALKMENNTKLKKYLSCKQQNMKKIYIQRKYNSKLAYQIHHIVQAKDIEDQKLHIKKGLRNGQESPLIRNVIKLTRTDRKSDKTNYLNKKDRTERHIELSFEVAQSRNVLKNNKLQEAMRAKNREYILPVMRDSKSNLKKYSSTMHLGTLLGSPSKN